MTAESLVGNLSFSCLQTQSASKELKYAQLIMTRFVIFYWNMDVRKKKHIWSTLDATIEVKNDDSLYKV